MFAATNKVFCDLCPAHFSFTNKLLSLLLVVKNYLMLLMYSFVGITALKILVRNYIFREVLQFSSTLKHFPSLQGQNDLISQEFMHARFFALNLYV